MTSFTDKSNVSLYSFSSRYSPELRREAMAPQLESWGDPDGPEAMKGAVERVACGMGEVLDEAVMQGEF